MGTWWVRVSTWYECEQIFIFIDKNMGTISYPQVLRVCVWKYYTRIIPYPLPFLSTIPFSNNKKTKSTNKITQLIVWETSCVSAKLNMLHVVSISLWLHATFVLISTIIRANFLLGRDIWCPCIYANCIFYCDLV